MTGQHRRILTASAGFGLLLCAAGLLLGDLRSTAEGLRTILTCQDLLITDYLALAGPGAALVNAGVMTLATVLLIRLTGDVCNGFTIVEVGLMAGFSLCGKNPLNCGPILLGAWLYARVRREPFSRDLAVGLLATALSPLVSWLMFGSAHGSPLLGALAGMAIGFMMPCLSAHTFRVLNGMNLYNVGFACGLLALMAVPVLTAVGDRPDPVLHWSTAWSPALCCALAALCAADLLTGLLGTGTRAGAVWRGWLRLLRTSGRAPSDYLRKFGAGPVLVNMGVNGLLGIGYILASGGQFSGPVACGVLTLMAFAGYGKHGRNMLPVMAGVALGALVLHRSPAAPALQLAGLFGTTLAPIAGVFGWPAGVLAGVLHSALVLQTGGPVAGMNLYNNGFAGGLIALVLDPLLTTLVCRRKPSLQDQDYFDVFEGDGPEPEGEEAP